VLTIKVCFTQRNGSRNNGTIGEDWFVVSGQQNVLVNSSRSKCIRLLTEFPKIKEDFRSTVYSQCEEKNGHIITLLI